MEIQNENSWKSSKWLISAQEEMQIFRQIGLGAKISKLWQILEKIGIGKFRARIKFRIIF